MNFWEILSVAVAAIIFIAMAINGIKTCFCGQDKEDDFIMRPETWDKTFED